MSQIPKFVNAKQIQALFAESGFKIGYSKAKTIKKNLKEEHVEVKLPDPNVIPLSWVYEAYGDVAYRNKKRDVS